MKKILLFLLTTIISFSSFAQNLPQGIAYQAVAVKEGPYSVAGENPQAIYWSNKDIKVRFTILDQYPNPMDTYQEFHSVTTDDYGVFNLIIGQGAVISGDFETIPWELGAAHLQVEIDFDNDDNYTVTSFERFWSVPYAFVSKKDEKMNMDSAIQALNDKITYLKNRDQDTVIGNEGITYKTIDSLNQVLQYKINNLLANDLDTIVGNEIQTLAIKGDSLSISDGNTVKIDFPANFDNDSTNEIQTISLSNDTIHLSKGGGDIALKDINDYVKSNTSSNNASSSYSQNSFCYEGTLIDLTSWGIKNNVSYAIPAGSVYDSAYVFSDNTSGTFVVDLTRDTIYKISNVSSTLNYVGDSVVYCCSSGGCDVIKINNDLSLSTNNFSGGPGLIKSGNGLPYGGGRAALVNASGDLIWLPYLWAGGRADFKKYSFANKTLTTTLNPDKNGYSEAAFVIRGDTILLGNSLIKSDNMKIITSYAFLKDIIRQSVSLFDNNIYYIDDPTNSNKLIKYNVYNNQSETIGYAPGLIFGGINNEHLLFTLNSGTPRQITMRNAGFYGTSGLFSISKNGLVNFIKFTLGSTYFNQFPTDNYGKIMSWIYLEKNSNMYYSNCFNKQFPTLNPGLFFSKN